MNKWFSWLLWFKKGIRPPIEPYVTCQSFINDGPLVAESEYSVLVLYGVSSLSYGVIGCISDVSNGELCGLSPLGSSLVMESELTTTHISCTSLSEHIQIISNLGINRSMLSSTSHIINPTN